VAAKPERVLRTIIRRPAGVSGPIPLVVFAHGYDSEPEVYEPLLDAWAAAGYMVAAPECPGSARDLPGAPVPDYGAQARDISFVISSLVGGSAGQVDPHEIAVAGHSDGGTAVTIMALDAPYADTRVKAYINLAGQIPPDVGGPWAATPTPGMLLVAVGDDDQYGNLALSTAMFDAAKMPKALLTVPGGDHLGTFVASTPTAQAVRAATTRFLGVVFAGPSQTATPAQLRGSLVGSGGSSPFSVQVGD
jgi:dienelactone hydrolase